MAVKVPRSDIVAQISQAKIELSDLIDFQADCLDETTVRIIVEALDYALEKSVSRLKSAGQIWPEVEAAAYGDSKHSGILPFIRGIREALLDVPICPGHIVPPPIMTPLEAMAVAVSKEKTGAKAKKAETKARKPETKSPKAETSAKKVETKAAPALTDEEKAIMVKLPADQRAVAEAALLKSRAAQFQAARGVQGALSEAETKEFIRKTYGNPGAWTKTLGPDGKVVRWESVDPTTGVARIVPPAFWPR